MPALDATSDLIATTTAWGKGQPLDASLARISAQTPAACVEISIGARPVADPRALLESLSDRFSYLAHHAAPILPGAFLRPETHSPKEAVAALRALGISRYTIHPPTKRRIARVEDFYTWAWEWFDTLGEAGIDVRLETMYTPRDREETNVVGGYHLDSNKATLDFCAAARARGIEIPLLIDLSHLFIGLHGQTWTNQDVLDVLTSDLSDHLHVSANDGRRDLHVPVPDAHPVMDWMTGNLDRFAYVVDEGRRDVPVSLLRALA